MRNLLAVIVFFFPIVYLGLNPPDYRPAIDLTEQKAETIRTSVSGFGNTESRAKDEAQRNARSVANGSYRTISTRITGSSGNYQCVLVIEYQRKR